MITLIVAVIGINMCLEFFCILDLIFLFWEVKKEGGRYSHLSIQTRSKHVGDWQR